VIARRSVGLFFALLALSATVVFVFGGLGDYPFDAGPAVTAVARGHLVAGLGTGALMGSLSILVRAPVVALTHAGGFGELWQYRLGAVTCLAPAAAAGVWFAVGIRERRGSTWFAGVVAALAVANPATAAAVAYGHPEEVLAAALAVGAVALAGRQRSMSAALALGLALAAKQWALLAVVPTILATPRPQRLRLVGVAAAVLAAFWLPVVAANPTGFLDVSHNAATTPHSMGRTSIWFLFAHAHTLHLHVPPGYPSEFVVYRIPVWVARLSHPMILVAALPFTALLARRGSGRPARDALAILALAFLLRCVLDPVDNAYYHAPLVLALLAWEVLGCARRVPLVTLLTSAALWITFDRVEPVARPTVANGVYLAWTTALLFYLVYALAVRRDAPRYSSNDAEVRTYEAATPVPTLGAHSRAASLARTRA
jgi:hypothetical protein